MVATWRQLFTGGTHSTLWVTFPSWPGCRLRINADAVATSYLAGLHRLFLEAKLAEKDHQTALQEANARAYEMETICLDPLARHLHQLFHTDDDLIFDVYPGSGSNSNDWTFGSYLSCKKSRGYADLSIKVRTRWTPPENYWRVVHLQPRLHAPVDSLSTLIVIVTFPAHTEKLFFLVCRHYNQRLLHHRPSMSKMSNECAWEAKHFLHSPSARLPTSPGCVLCRPPSPRRSRSCYLPSLYQVWPWGCVAHSGRNPQIASFAERESPPTAG